MIHIKQGLMKRRKITIGILGIVALIALGINHFFQVSPPSYIPAKWQMPIVYGLIVYKIIELGLFYLFLYHRQYLKVVDNAFHTDALQNFEKYAKKFFFLVPQGSIVFGILSYKLSGSIYFLWLFLVIALFVLWTVNPNKLEESLSSNK